MGVELSENAELAEFVTGFGGKSESPSGQVVTDVPTIVSKDEAAELQALADQIDGKQAEPATEAAPAAPKSDLTPRPAQPPGALKALLEREKQLREREESLKAWEREVEEVRGLRELAKRDKGALMEKFGLSREDLPEKKADDPVAQLQEKLAQMEKYVTDMQKREQESQREQAFSQAKDSLKAWIDTVPDYEPIRKVGAYDAVFDHIQATYQATGKVLSEEEAAGEVNARLMELARAMAPLLQEVKPQNSHPKTLTGSLAAQAGTPDLSKMDDDEAIAFMAANYRSPTKGR